MKQFDTWFAEYIEMSDIPGYQPMCQDAFRAGMLAAADIAEEGYPFVESPYAGGRRDAAENIRDEANGND